MRPRATRVGVHGAKLERCIFRRGAGRLDLQAENSTGGEFLIVQLTGFDGAKSYTTNGGHGETDTFVALRGSTGAADASDSTSAGGAAAGDCPANACTINVTAADVASAPVGSKGRLTATVACPKTGAAAVGCVTCTWTSFTASFDVPGCDVAD